jgi:hypothetical protein
VILPQAIDQCKRSIEKRLNGPINQDLSRPMFSASNIHYELADRTRAIGHGGIGLMQGLVKGTGLAEAINRHLKLLKIHLPYHESDHVLNIAYNALWALPVLGANAAQTRVLSLAAIIRRATAPRTPPARDSRRVRPPRRNVARRRGSRA